MTRMSMNYNPIDFNQRTQQWHPEMSTASGGFRFENLLAMAINAFFGLFWVSMMLPKEGHLH